LATSDGSPVATACVRQPSACSVGHVVSAKPGELSDGKVDGAHPALLAALAEDAGQAATTMSASRAARRTWGVYLTFRQPVNPRGCQASARVNVTCVTPLGEEMASIS
jgi:hypothetical protein